MPIKYVGRTTSYRGKTAWEILGNLKNFGVGRIIVRTQTERFSEPSYCRVVRAEPQMDSENKFGKLWVEKVFRGKQIPGIHDISKVTYKADYRLLSKYEEEEYCNRSKEREPERVLPREIPFPPLLREFVLQERQKNGEQSAAEPMMTAVYNVNPKYNNYRIANEGETPTVNITLALGTPASPELYATIQKEKPSLNNKNAKTS